MSHEVHWQGTPLEELNPVDAGNALQDDLTMDQELALVDHDPYELDPVEPADAYDL